MLTQDSFEAHDDPDCVSITLDHKILCQYSKRDDDLLEVGFKDASVSSGFWPAWFPSEAAIVGWLIQKLSDNGRHRQQ